MVAPAPPERQAGPRFLTCYVCGTQHGIASLAIHQKQCLENRSKLQANLDPTERTAVPQDPGIAIPGEAATEDDVNMFNEAVQAVYEAGMPKCPKCDRSFADSTKLAKHSAGCGSGRWMPGGTGRGKGLQRGAWGKLELQQQLAPS